MPSPAMVTTLFQTDSILIPTLSTGADFIAAIFTELNRMRYFAGDMVYFWTGRGSHGYGIIQRICPDRMFIDPEPDAKKGSDYRILKNGKEYWSPRNWGVPLDQIDTPPRIWYSNF
jgi:hypothetical protein